MPISMGFGFAWVEQRSGHELHAVAFARANLMQETYDTLRPKARTGAFGSCRRRGLQRWEQRLSNERWLAGACAITFRCICNRSSEIGPL
jgi:hypothetical protein